MAINVAYVASGKLHLRYDGAAPRAVESKFAQEVRERLLRVAQFMYGRLMNSRFLCRQDGEDEQGLALSVRSLTRGSRDGEVPNSLGGSGVAGLFAFDPEALEEKRIVHGVERLLFALLHSLNFFSTRYSGKQLTTAAAFDLASDGSGVCTNGNSVFHRTREGETTNVCQADYVSHVLAL